MRLLIFNPDTDLALANSCENFEAPKSSKQFTKDLELLPLVYADYEDIILIDNLKSVSHLTDKITSVIPWGWNQALRKKLLKIGVGETVIPTYNDVQTIRDLSHRKSSVYILEKLKSCDSYYYPLPVTPKIITNANVGLDLYTDSPDSLFKTPWSNSGKGIWWKNTGSVDLLSKWLQSSISKFGSVIYEKEYHKILDFAMIFKNNSIGDIDFCGYSLFKTDIKGAYASNQIASNERLEKILLEYLPLQQLKDLVFSLKNILKQLIEDHYSGYFGIDMMICEVPGTDKYLLHPCVELNLRITMGVVSRFISDKYTNGNEGVFSIIYDRENLSRQIEKLKEKYPLKEENNKIIKGFKTLTPVTADTQYCAFVHIL